ncbi:hypothetical protein MMC14_007113 [Varicellaria rhodocarpa]|nr:hypothetical protein [Varicellaria rhodocarpa]
MSFSPLLRLPAELRIEIYKFVLARQPDRSGRYHHPYSTPNDWESRNRLGDLRPSQTSFSVPSAEEFANDLAILRTSRQLYWETIPLLYKEETNGPIAITMYQPRIVQSSKKELDSSRTSVDSGSHSRAEIVSRHKMRIRHRRKGPKDQQEKNSLSHRPQLFQIKPHTQVPWNWTCTYCKNHQATFTNYPGCDCIMSPRLARIPPLDVIARAKEVTIAIIWPREIDPLGPIEYRLQLADDLAELRSILKRLAILIRKNIEANGGSVALRVIVNAIYGESRRDELRQEISQLLSVLRD